jgi:hypothetical protein
LQHHFANTEGGYTVLCAKPVPDNMAKVVKIPSSTKRIIMGTDGYPIMLFDPTAFQSVADMEASLAAINSIDPHCMIENPGPKGIARNRETGELNASYDDRSVIDIAVKEY